MKKTLLAAIVPFALLGASSAFADNVDCATKIRAIDAQIDYARQHGNTGRIAGLQDALANTKANCSNAGLAARADRKLRDARHDGKAKKVLKAERNLADKQRKLREKTEDLRSAETDRAALKG
jgi:hypothetical protein